METLVIDASAVVEIFVAARPHPELRRRAITANLTAPEVLDPEVINVLRRMERGRLITEDQARLAAMHLIDVSITRASHRSLVPRIWDLRHTINSYDAAYVALAEQLEVPLVTCDAKLAAAHGHKARIELYPTG